MSSPTFVYLRDQRGDLPRRVTLEDPLLPHQIRVALSGHPAKVSIYCTCQGPDNKPHKPLATGNYFPDGQDMVIWRAHVAAVEPTL